MTIRPHLRFLAPLALAFAAAGAQAAPAARSGNLVYDTDVVTIGFTLASAGKVSIWTDSWSAGLNFDPTVSLFDATSLQRLATGDDTPDPALLHPGQGGYDSEIDFASLGAGRYFIALSASGNDPLGASYTDGFSLAGTPPIRIGDWNQPSYDINLNDQKGSFWRVEIDGATTVAAVPEPREWALLTLGLVVVWSLRRRRDLDGR